MNRRLEFGDVVMINPTETWVEQPDPRRWMVISFDDRMRWTLLYIGPAEDEPVPVGTFGPTLAHFDSLYGFVSVDE